MKGKKYGMRFVVKLIVAIVLIFAIGRTTLASYALIDGTNAVRISSSRIENATLIIGTHLIYIGSMNDQIYEMAEKSAQEANQHKRYYKSEIAGGTWYDITEADSLADITTEGIAVPNKEVESLYLTHHTKSDGLTYYLKKNSAVCIYDINDPYNLETMTEMEPVKLQYDAMVKVKEPSETMSRDLLYLKEIYKIDRETPETKELDEKIAALQNYYKKLLKDSSDSAMCDVVMSVMEKLDAYRRVAVLKSLNESQLLKMSQLIGSEYVYIEGEITGDTDSVDEDQKLRAQKAAEEARKQTEAEVQERINELKAELSELEAERDAAVEEKTDEIKDGWARIIEIETDETKIAEYKRLMNAEVQTASEEIKKEFASQISAKQNEINYEESGKEAKAQKAANDASTAVMNAKRETLELFVPNTELLAAISESMMNVYESYITYSSKMFQEGTTVLSQTEYRLVNELVEKANSESYVSCDRVVMKLMYLDRINHGVIREEVLEREFIEEEILKEAQMSYRSSLEAGIGAEYKALSSTATASAKSNALKNQLNETEMKRNELQFILQAYVDRMTPQEAVEYLAERMEEVESFEKVIKSDLYKEYAQNSVDAYSQWLSKTLEKLHGISTNSTMENLIQQKNDLQTELLTALDQEQLDKAEKIEAEIAAIDLEIEEVEKYLNNIISSETSSEAGKAIAQAQLTAGTASATLKELKEEALQNIKNGNLDTVEATLEGIGALAQLQPAGTLEALKEIYREVAKQELLGQDSAKLNILAEKVEEITAAQLKHFSKRYSENDLATLISVFINGEAMELQEEKQNRTDIRQDRLNQNSGNDDSQEMSDEDLFEDDLMEDDGEYMTEDEEYLFDDEEYSFEDDEYMSEDEEYLFEDDEEMFEDEEYLFDDEEDLPEDEDDLMEDDEEIDGEELSDEDFTEEYPRDSKMDRVMENLNQEQTAIVLAGLSMYAEQNFSEEIETILNVYGRIAFNNGNRYIHEQLKDPTYEAIPTDQIAEITGFRYIFSDSAKAVTLQKSGQYYKFEAFSNIAEKGNSILEMTKAAGFRNVVYIPEDMVKEYFDLTTQYLGDTSYGAILTGKMEQQALAFMDYLLDTNGEL